MDRNMKVIEYQEYENKGHLVMSVTLSTLVKSNDFAKSEKMSCMWTKHFTEKLIKRLPKSATSNSIVSDYVIEQCNLGYWGFHGLVAVKGIYADKFWKDGTINKHLTNDLRSFSYRGNYRTCSINTFLIERIKNTQDWVNYINKRHQERYVEL